ncbi:MAG: phoR, partial [Frankiales bacterium]|nr:phoR [Frankiales bacterium]
LRWAQEAEAARERAVRRQEVVDQARHDIRTPLGAGKGYAQLLATRRERMTPEQVSTALEGLRSSFERIEAFTGRLLVDDRLDATDPTPRWALVDVVALLERVRQDAVATTGREDAVLVHRLEDAPDALAGDPEHVREVVDNLVGNALKYGGTAGPVHVTVRAEGDQVRLDVRDSGPGIPEGEQAALFERWSRTDAARAGLLPGLGLGLSIVKRLVLAHGGLLGVSSRPGEGATFWVTFPRAVPDPG